MNAKVGSSLSTGTLAPDRNTQYFKITIWSIALHFGIALAKPSKRIALLISILIVMPRVRSLERAIALSLILTASDRAVGGN